MMLTREQAAEVWCPMVRLVKADGGGVDAGQVAFNRADVDGKAGIATSSRCIADKCAMWRWGATTDPDWWPPENAWAIPLTMPRMVQSDRGYCGLAGAPAIGAAA